MAIVLPVQAVRGASQPSYWRRLTALGASIGAPLGVLLALATGAGGDDGSGEPPPAAVADAVEKPNIVVVMTDDEALWGGEATPETNQLIGAAGVTFLNSFATDPLCCPSRATMLTGQYAHNHGVISNGGPNALPALRAHQTLPVWMRSAGYTTALIGKYLNGYDEKDPPAPGWDRWYALTEPTTQDYVEYTLNENGKRRDYGPAPEEYKTHVLGSKAVATIRDTSRGDRPLFLYLGFNAPHSPATPAPRDVGAFADHPLPDVPNYGEEDVSDKPSFIRDQPPPQNLDASVSDYQENALESLLSVDREVERIVAELKRRDELDNTYIFFTSDNGYFAGEHRISYGKLLPYEASSRVPLMVRGPGIDPETTSKALVGNIDLAPTIAALAGAEPTLELDGNPLLPLREEADDDAERPLVIEGLVRDRSVYYGIPYSAIRTQRYLYVEYENGSQELYDYERDPYELESRDAAAGYAAVEKSLSQALAAYRDCAGDACAAELEAPPEPE